VVSDLQRRVQRHDAAAVDAETQFHLAAKHAFGFFSPDHTFFKLGTVRQNRTGQGHGRQHALADIGCTANDLIAAISRIDLADGQLVGVGMGAYFCNAPDKDRLQVSIAIRNRVHFQSRHGQRIRQIGGIHLDVYVVVQPTQTDFHSIRL